MMQPPSHIPNGNLNMSDDPYMNSDDIEETQQPTQQTQLASQPTVNSQDSHLWGYLQPCSPALARIDFWKLSPQVILGRANASDVVLPGFKVSNKHCKISWDGKEDKTSCVVVQDFSSNGTFINGEKVGKERTAILREGNEIAFGTCLPQHSTNALEDYRFVYRHTAAGPPNEGLYAHYDISNELGKGSFATVMKAVSRTTGEWFAVKMIQTSKVKPAAGATGVNGAGGETKASSKTSFAREISILETLKHPNICQLKEVFFETATINLVLELVDGGDLLDYILNRSGLSEPEAQHITYQMCDALAYCHSMNIAHRDLKPESRNLV